MNRWRMDGHCSARPSPGSTPNGQDGSGSGSTTRTGKPGTSSTRSRCSASTWARRHECRNRSACRAMWSAKTATGSSSRRAGTSRLRTAPRGSEYDVTSSRLRMRTGCRDEPLASRLAGRSDGPGSRWIRQPDVPARHRPRVVRGERAESRRPPLGLPRRSRLPIRASGFRGRHPDARADLGVGRRARSSLGRRREATRSPRDTGVRVRGRPDPRAPPRARQRMAARRRRGAGGPGLARPGRAGDGDRSALGGRPHHTRRHFPRDRSLRRDLRTAGPRRADPSGRPALEPARPERPAGAARLGAVRAARLCRPNSARPR